MIEVNPPLLLLLAVGSTVAAVFIAGCTGGGSKEPGAIIRTVPPAEASALIEEMGQDPKVTAIDVRRPDEFAGGHIPGAINIDSRYFAERLGDLDRNGAYVICCQRGGRSAAVWELMRDAGFREVYEVEGGMSAWTAAGLPVTRE